MTFEEIKELEIPLGKAGDLTGQKFGQLTALFRVQGKRQRWACQCECGNYVMVNRCNLVSGHTKSCGQHQWKDISGQQFGYLTALNPTDKRDCNGGVVWTCQCDCGEIVDVPATWLTQGWKVRCGDNHEANLMIGKQFGELTVLSYIRRNKFGHTTYNCQCSCGKTTVVEGNNLFTGDTKTCGDPIHKIKDITGQRFGHLTALYPTGESRFESAVWHCVCDCGEEVDANLKTLRSGDRVQCDNHYKNEIIGNTFGKLMAIGYAGVINGNSYYTCQCECGRVVDVMGASLKTGNTQSCGCCIQSIGEMNVENILKKNKKPYIQQMMFDTCRYPDTNRKARFDFYVVVSDPFLLEFDGIQHSGYSGHLWNTKENHITTRNHDLFKNQWAWDNEVPMKRIPYQYRDKLALEDILSDKFLITPETHPECYPDKNATYPYYCNEDAELKAS